MTASGWSPVLAGRSFNGYTLDTSPLGEGGFGVVFRATKDDTGLSLAIKMLLPTVNGESVDDFDNEGLLLEKLLGSKNVVQLADSSGHFHIELSAPPNPNPIPMQVKYHVLEIADGCLDGHIVANDLSWLRKLQIWRDVVRGIHQMHMKYVAHRDLKSSNCLMFDHGKSIKLSDLGRSRDLSAPSRHHPNSYLLGMGDFTYAPPEFLFLQGRDTERAHRDADLYGLGSLLFELATGVSITSQVFPSIWYVLDQAKQDVARGHYMDLDALRPMYAAAVQSIEDDVPTPIRSRMLELLQTLCDPVPENRRKAEGAKGKIARNSLESILREIDISIRQLRLSETKLKKTTGKGS